LAWLQRAFACNRPPNVCTDMSSPRVAACNTISSDNDSHKGNVGDTSGKPPCNGVSPAAVQHPADQACGGSFSVQKPAAAASAQCLWDHHRDGHGKEPCTEVGCLEVHKGMATESAKTEYHLSKANTQVVLSDEMTKGCDVSAEPPPPDATSGIFARMAPTLPSTWCIMDEYEVSWIRLPAPVATPSSRKWMHNTPQCEICIANFGPFTRRHHCRKCGRNVCNACSPFRVNLKAPLAHPSRPETGPCRICVGCHEPC